MSRLHNARKRLRKLLGSLLGAILVATLLVPPAALAAEGTVRFGVRVLQASSPGAPQRGAPAGVQGGLTPPPGPGSPEPSRAVEPELDRILPRLRTLFRYTEYTTLERHRADVSVGRQHVISIVGTRRLEVIPDEVQGGSVRMRVRLLRGDQDEIRTTIVAAPGAPAVLGGPPHGDGALIIILWAHPGP
jgi:hypothetical protein